MSVIDDYLLHTTPAQKGSLEHIRELVKQAAPEAEEVISYGVPAFKINKHPLLYMGAFRDHMSIFPASDGMLEAIPEIGSFRTSKGTLQFTETNPIPDKILERIISYRLGTIS